MKKPRMTDYSDGECLPIECVCGYGKAPWTFLISIYKESPTECPVCGRKYYYTQKTTIHEVKKKGPEGP